MLMSHCVLKWFSEFNKLSNDNIHLNKRKFDQNNQNLTEFYLKHIS